MAMPVANSCTRSTAVVLLALMALALGPGCGNPAATEANPEKVFDSIQPGMTMAEVEAALGSGDEVAYEQLPQSYRTALGVLDIPPKNDTSAAKGDSIKYRKWSREAGGVKAIAYVAFRDGKVVKNSVFVQKISGGTVRSEI